jgi:hypothetical protein
MNDRDTEKNRRFHEFLNPKQAQIHRLRPGLYIRNERPNRYLVVWRSERGWKFSRVYWLGKPEEIDTRFLELGRATFPTYARALAIADGNWAK